MSASLFESLRMWKHLKEVNSWRMYLSLCRLLFRTSSLNWPFEYIFLIRILDSPNTCSSLNPLSLAIWPAFIKLKISTWLFVHCPNPQLKVSLMDPSREYTRPPTPVVPGFPLEAPSKQILVVPCFLHQLWKISSLSLNLHSGLSWGFIVLWFLCHKTKVLNHLFSSGSNEVSGLRTWVLNVSRSRPFALASTMLGVQAILLKICSFLASHNFQQENLGMVIQTWAQRDLLMKVKGYRSFHV